MMPNIKITTDNRKEVIAAKDAAVAKVLEMWGLIAEGYAKDAITAAGRVDTGAMRNDVTHATDDDTMYVGNNIEYAIYHEFGTSKMEGIHHIRDAVAEHIDEYKRIADAELKS